MFRKIIRHLRGMVLLYVALGIAAAGVSTLSVVFFQRMVDLLSGQGGTQPLPLLLALYGATYFLTLAFEYIEEYPDNQLRHGIYQHVKQLALEKVSTIDYTAYLDTGTGRLVQLVENGANAGRDILFDFYLRIAARLAPEALAAIVLMGVYSPGIMLAAISGYVAVFAITKILLKKLYSVKERTLVSEEWLSKAYVRAFMEMVVFRVNRRFGPELERVEHKAKEITDSHTHLRMIHEFFFASFAVIVLAIKLALIGVSAAHVLRGEMSIGVLLAHLTLIDRMYQPIAIFNVIYVDYKLSRVTWDRFMRFMDRPDDPNLRAGQPFRLDHGEIRMEDVSFAYGETEVLGGVNLVIRPGEKVAFVGKSGGGKSTLVKLVLGLIKPTKGRICVDGQDLASLRLDTYYRDIAYLSQDTPIFDGTLRENICFDKDIPNDRLYQILEQVQLGDLMARLPAKLDTEVGERGIKLSGGEKQRLAFARVMAQSPTIVILDEPTSALDQETERQVMRAMRRTLRNATILYIAHRMATVQYADRIVVLDDGRIVEMGTHEGLMLEEGVYASLAKAGKA